MKLRLLLALLVLAPGTGAAAQDGGDWSQFRRDPALTGIAAAPLGDELELKWSVPLGFSVESSPAIAGNFVYATSLPGVLVKLNLEDGEAAWTYRPGAAEAEAGEFEDDRFGESSPAVADGAVFVGDLMGVLHAVDAASGDVRWRFETGAEIKSSPVVAGDLVLIGSYDEYFYGVDRATGKVRWSLQTEGPVHATPGRDGGLAWVTGCDAVLRGVRIKDGTEMLRFDSGAYTAASPAIADGTLYYGTFNNEVLAVDVDAGALRWRYEHPERHFPFYASAAITSDLVIVAGRDKLVHGLDRETGAARWTFRARARFDSSPAVAGGRVYAGNADGRLYVLDLESGEKLSEFHAGAAIMGSPAIAGGRIVFGTQDGTLFALGPASR